MSWNNKDVDKWFIKLKLSRELSLSIFDICGLKLSTKKLNIVFQTKLEVYGLIVNVNNGGTRV